MEITPGSPPTWQLRLRRTAPFIAAVACCLPLLLIQPRTSHTAPLAALAVACMLLAGVANVAVPWHRIEWQWPRLALVALYCFGVHLLRQSGGGGGSGYAGLLLLAVVWQAVYRGRREVVATIVLVAVVLVGPLLLLPSDYPATGARAVVVDLIGFTLTGVVVQTLIARIRQNEHLLATVAAQAGRLASDTGGGLQICESVARTTEADWATLTAIDPSDRLRIIASASTQDAGWSVQGLAPAGWSGPAALSEALFVPRPGMIEAGGDELLRSGSLLHQPYFRGDHVAGLMTVGWASPRRQPGPGVQLALGLLAPAVGLAVERAELLARLEQLAHHDDLTGLANRRAWNEVLDVALGDASNDKTTLTMALLDLDHFKRFNDEHGHLEGDRLLRDLATAWSAELRATDVLARWGGEEFALLLPRTSITEAEVILRRLRRVTPEGQSFSAGLTVHHGRDARTLMQEADAALYEAKSSGRDRFVVATRSSA